MLKRLCTLLFHTEGSRDFLQNEWHFGEPNREILDRHVKKKSPPGRGKKPHDKKTKRWHRDGSLDDEFDTETTFADRKSQSHKAYSYSKDSTSGFEWRQDFSWANQSQRNKNWGDESSCDEEPLIVESMSQRTVLGLPPIGPLKISDVKNA
ncbi:Chaperone J-domain superfamily [Arabidopsis thaliana x Arabidopsis arenosa]|nr:Chaperone J-domain superfamily [Arabidopsis thaliana x Arabidopsis arenosa]